MTSNGIHFRFFEPLLKTKACYMGRRLHQKIICIDNQKALVGGINIANRYNDFPKRKAWLDFAVFIEGEVVIAINDFCHSIWHSLPYRDIEINIDAKKTFEKINTNERCKIRIRRNDWIRHKNEISISYLEMLRNAKEEVIILCSYFIPGKAIRRLLAAAAKRGVNIKVITAGPSDVMIAKRAERWLYDWLLRNNIELYEYQKNILHGKLAVADKQQITIGSYNINNISTYTSIELNVDIDNVYLAKQLHHKLTTIINQDCYKITQQNHQLAKNPFIQLNRWFSYQFISIVLKAVTFFFKREH
jgi:cardiolipin synthase